MADPSAKRGSTVHLHVWVQEQELEQLRRLAAERRTTVSALVRGKLREVPGMDDWRLEPDLPHELSALRPGRVLAARKTVAAPS